MATQTFLDANELVLNMGPQHPSTHGVLRVILNLDGEKILGTDCVIGYLHRGVEKIAENRTYPMFTPYVDRMDYVASISNGLGYCLAVEKLMNLPAPPRAEAVRVILTELNRIASHLVWLGTHALDIGAMTVFFYCFREREDILRIKEMFSGQRMMTSYIRPGGLALEPPRGWQKVVRKFIDAFPEKVDEYEDLLEKNPIWLRRTQGVGYFALDDMLDLGITGPMIRGAGVPLDVRKMTPYSSYEKFDFKVCTHDANDVYARYRVRLSEFRESQKIVKQALEGMPAGPWQADAPKMLLPDREKMKTQMEALIYHFKIVTEGYRVPAGEAYQAVESPRGEIAYYVVSNGTSKPHRVYMRTPSFGNLQGLGPMIEGCLIADTIAAMGSMDFVLGDVDR